MNASASSDGTDLQARCEACSALCCITHPFDATQGFGFDKPAHTACTHLRDDFRCGIHDQLAAKGFAGCIQYSCHGAGQRVTKLYADSNWRNAPAKALEIYTVFSRMKSLHELQLLLHTAQRTIPDKTWQQRITQQLLDVEAQCRQLEQQQGEVDIEATREKTHELLRQLATEPAIIALRMQRPATRG